MLESKKHVPAPRLVDIHPNPGPRGGVPLDEEQRWRITLLHKDNKLSPYAIAKKLHIKYDTAASVIKKHQERNSS